MMMNFGFLDGVDEISTRNNMQDWMISERMYNCDGFSANYYRDQAAGAKKGFRLFGKKDI